MAKDTRAFFAAEEAFARGPITESRQAHWEFATTGTEAAQEQERRKALAVRRHFADEGRYAQLDAWHAKGPSGDAILDRQGDLLWREYLGGQQDGQTLERLTQLSAEQQGLFNRFRASLDGRSWSENDLNEVLAASVDSAEVRRTWEAAKQIGAEAAGPAREMLRLRNESARRQGFADAFQKDLVLGELGDERLFSLLDELEQATDAPYRQAKVKLDEQLAQHFKVGADDLRPWHYGDPFFQRPPRSAGPPLDPFFAGKRPEDLVVRTLDTVGLEARGILARSDLYPRPGKNQHAFCMYVQPNGSDVRVLCNLNETYHWTSVLLHELGHAMHWEYGNRELPDLLVDPPHSLVAETESQLLERVAVTAPWLTEVAGVPAARSAELANQLQEAQRVEGLVFARWSLVMAHFERAMFRDPDGDLDALWWDLIERFQLVPRPEGRKAPDWAAKIHLANFPGHYYVYILGEMAVAQFYASLMRDVGGFYGHRGAGAHLIERLYRLGSRYDWETTVEQATGQRLGTAAMVQELITVP